MLDVNNLCKIGQTLRSFEQTIRVQRYRILRHLGGQIGDCNSKKYRIKLVLKEFDNALPCVAGMTCIDLGAHIGKYTSKLATVAGKVIAFEPHPKSFRALQKRTLAYRNVILKNVAAGVEDKVTLLYRALEIDRSYGHNVGSVGCTVVITDRTYSPNLAIPVTQIDFITYLERLDENIGILKIDIEGSETELLEALFERPDLLNRIKFIFAETHEKWIPSHKTRIEKLKEKSKQFPNCNICLDWP